MNRLLPLLLLFAGLARTQAVGPGLPQPTVHAVVFSAITAGTASNPVRNIGQIQHTIKIGFPTAVGAVSPIQVRIEASFDNSAGSYFPICPDVTLAPLLTGSTTSVYAFANAYGVYPFVRVNSVVATPGALPLTVHYIGYVFPIVPFLTLMSDRYVF
jgi:hypothetical protein